jgi:membrane protease YdiL (CAAX protease family)
MMTPRATMIVVPLAVLGVSRLGAEVFVRLYPLRYAWIPSLIVYYLAIEAAVVWVRRAIPDAPDGLSFRSGARPSRRRLIYGVVIPALLPLGFFILNVRMVPLAVLGAIVVFAPINAYFEEVFWRGLMSCLPASDRVRILWSGGLFAFSHWFFTGAYWLSRPRVLIPVVITTFMMGIAWMWFYLKERSLAYTIASHCVVDVLNLSVAVFLGLRLRTV